MAQTQWTFDPVHSNADFAVKHMMVTTVRGGFKEVTGSMNFDRENADLCSVQATIKTASIWTGVADRDGHLRSPDFLDVESYPEMTFKSTSVEIKDANHATVTGDLTIRDVTKPVTLEVELQGEGKDPFSGRTVMGFTAETKINREDWGLTWNQALESGGWLVGKEVKITLDVEAVPVEQTATA